jgi:hypothetical protein
MLIRTLIAAALFSASLAYAADFDRTLPVSSHPDLYVSTGSGHIHITPGSDASIHIHAHVYAGWNAGGDTDERIRRIAANPPIQQSGDAIHIGEVDSSLRGLFNKITIDYDITAPRAVALNLHTGSGDVDVDNLGRFLKAQTGSGSLRVHGLSGPADLHTGSGDIELQEQGQGDVKASTGSGSIRINGLAGGLDAATGSGDIEAGGRIAGNSHLKSGSGSIRLHLGREARITLAASTGSGTIRYPGGTNSDAHHVEAPINGGGPEVEAHTGSGDIEVN